MLSKYLILYRKSHGMSQAELAAVLQVPQNTLSQYETGKRTPTFKRAVLIASKLGCTVDSLADGDSSVFSCCDAPEARPGA